MIVGRRHDRLQVQYLHLLPTVLANVAPDNVGGYLLEQVLLGLVDLVALGAAGRYLLVQLLYVAGAHVRDLLQHLEYVRELGAQYFVRLHAERNE